MAQYKQSIPRPRMLSTAAFASIVRSVCALVEVKAAQPIAVIGSAGDVRLRPGRTVPASRQPNASVVARDRCRWRTPRRRHTSGTVNMPRPFPAYDYRERHASRTLGRLCRLRSKARPLTQSLLPVIRKPSASPIILHTGSVAVFLVGKLGSKTLHQRAQSIPFSFDCRYRAAVIERRERHVDAR